MKALFTVNLVVAVVFGLGFFLVPHTLMGLYGGSLGDLGIAIARLFGAVTLGQAVLFTFARSTTSIEFKKGVVYSLFTYWLLGTIVLLMAQLAGLMNWMGWATIGLHGVLLVWYGYSLFTKAWE